ncbi:hypothetical protein RhiJN_00993 [Ceratobasidium sp. AG-Ba]|nr:hypothetical protein RhiJN_00993 [Ceratobasidium sp. AG-Ba]QRW02023.1 hypothetical protein RhiLY_01020 [Ceratobasidium sp. AG-Ba]
MSTTKRSQPATRKPRTSRRARRALADSDDEVERLAHSSDSEHSDSHSDTSDNDTASSSDDDELDTPAAPATATDHSVSPPSRRTNRKNRKPPSGSADVPIVAPSLIPAQPDWSDLVAQDDGIQAPNPPIVDFADFISNGVDAIPEAGPSSGPEPASTSRGRPKLRGGKTQRQAYLDKLSEDPSYTPRVGAFWNHDERLLAPELRGMSPWWRDRRSGRGRGTGRGRGRGRAEFVESRPEAPAQPPVDAPPAPSPPPIERTWGHDGFEKMKEQEQSHSTRGRGRGRGRGHGRGTGRATREPEQLWTKAPDTHLHVDPSTRPQFAGQGRGIKVNIPGQWRPTIVRLSKRAAPSTSTHVTPKTTTLTSPAEIIVKLPGQQAKVVPLPVVQKETKSALPEDPVTVLPLQEDPQVVVARLPGTSEPTSAPGRTELMSAPPSSAKGSATADAPLRSNNMVPAPIPPTDKQPSSKPAPRAPVYGRTRSQLDAVAFARTALPVSESAPLAFGSLPTPVVASAPNVAAPPVPEVAPPPAPAQGEMPALAITVPPPVVQPLPNPAASFTPPASAYTPHSHNPYAYYTPIDGAAYYSTATPPPVQPHMYYPQAPFFAPPRTSGPVSIRPPGESAAEETRSSVPAPPMWNHYPHSYSHSHSHSHGSYYSPSATPYPPHPPPPRGYYAHGGEYAQPSDYTGMYDGYAAPGAHVYY